MNESDPRSDVHYLGSNKLTSQLGAGHDSGSK